MRYRSILRSLAAVEVMLLCGSSRAGVSPTTFLFDLEEQPVTGPSALTSLTLGPGGLVTITAPAPGAFGIEDVSLRHYRDAFPLGTRSIRPDLNSTSPYTANFARSVSSFSIEFGDASAQGNDQLSLKAFSGPNGTGSLLASENAILDSDPSEFTLMTLTVAAQGIESVQFIGGPPNIYNQIVYDNLSVATNSGGTAVPLPSSAALFPLGAATAVLAGRRLKRQCN